MPVNTFLWTFATLHDAADAAYSFPGLTDLILWRDNNLHDQTEEERQWLPSDLKGIFIVPSSIRCIPNNIASSPKVYFSDGPPLAHL